MIQEIKRFRVTCDDCARVWEGQYTMPEPSVSIAEILPDRWKCDKDGKTYCPDCDVPAEKPEAGT